MEQHVEDKIIKMMASDDPEIRELSIQLAIASIKSFSDYNSLRARYNHPTVMLLTKSQHNRIRKLVINSYGKLRKIYKDNSWHGVKTLNRKERKIYKSKNQQK